MKTVVVIGALALGSILAISGGSRVDAQIMPIGAAQSARIGEAINEAGQRQIVIGNIDAMRQTNAIGVDRVVSNVIIGDKIYGS